MLRVYLRAGVIDSRAVRRFDHRDQVNCLAFNRASRWLASGSSDGSISIWDLRNNRVLRSLSHGAIVNDLAFSVDGGQLLSASKKGIHLWDVVAGNELDHFPGDMRSVAWMPDGQGFVESLRDLNRRPPAPGSREPLAAQPWSMLMNFDGSNAKPLQGVNASAANLQPYDGGTMILGRTDQINVWNAGDGQLQRSFGADIEAAAYGAGRQHALTGDSAGAVALWNTVSGKKVQDVGKLSGKITALAMSTDGRLGAATDGQVLHIFTLQPERIPYRRSRLMLSNAAMALAVSPSNPLAITAGDRGVQAWQLDGTISNELAATSSVSSLSVSSDGLRMLYARGKPDRGGFGRIVVLAEPRVSGLGVAEIRSYIGHKGGTSAAQFVPGTNQIVSGGNDQHLRVWEANSDRQLKEININASPTALATTDGGDLAVVLSEANEPGVWNLNTGQRLGQLKGHSLPPRAVAVGRESRRAATASADRTVRVWDLESLECLATFDSPAALNCVQLSPNGKLVISGGQDGMLRVWDVDRQQPVEAWMAHDGPLTGLALSLDGHTMSSIGADLALNWWDVPDRKSK